MDPQLLLSILGISVILITLLYFLFITSKSQPKAWKKKTKNNLAELDKRFEMGDLMHMKSVVIDADKLLDYVMKSRGVKGETMGERLKKVDKYFDKNKYNQIWSAHKMRNQLVHEVDFTVMESELKESYSTLKSAIYKLIS